MDYLVNYSREWRLPSEFDDSGVKQTGKDGDGTSDDGTNDNYEGSRSEDGSHRKSKHGYFLEQCKRGHLRKYGRPPCGLQ